MWRMCQSFERRKPIMSASLNCSWNGKTFSIYEMRISSYGRKWFNKTCQNNTWGYQRFWIWRLPTYLDQKGNLVGHSRIIHETVKRIKCDECVNHLNGGNPLCRHLWTVHGMAKHFRCSLCIFHDMSWSYQTNRVPGFYIIWWF